MPDTPMTPTAEKRAEDLWETTILCDLVPGKQSAADVIDVIAVAIRAAEQAAVAQEKKRCVEACENQQKIFASNQYALGQPRSSFSERFACGACITAIEAGERKGE